MVRVSPHPNPLPQAGEGTVGCSFVSSAGGRGNCWVLALILTLIRFKQRQALFQRHWLLHLVHQRGGERIHAG